MSMAQKQFYFEDSRSWLRPSVAEKRPDHAATGQICRRVWRLLSDSLRQGFRAEESFAGRDPARRVEERVSRPVDDRFRGRTGMAAQTLGAVSRDGSAGNSRYL